MMLDTSGATDFPTRNSLSDLTRLMRLALLFGGLWLLPTLSYAQDGQSSANSILRARLDSIVRTALQTSPIAGVSVAVVHKSDTLLHQAYGYADLGLQAPTTTATTYRLVFPAAAIGIMQQVEQRRISLDDDAARYLPELNWQGRRVTIRQLLDATSGLRDYHYLGDVQKLQRALPQTTRDVADLFMRYPFVHEPGAGSTWTISGFHLAGMILERITRTSYGDYLRDNVFRRAGLNHTFYCPEGEITPGLATPYFYASGGRFVVAPYQSPSHYPYLLTVCTTAGDAISLLRALRDGRLLGAEAYREMTTPVGAGREASRAVGIALGEESGHRRIGSSGFLIGYNTTMYDFPDDSLTVVVLQNTIRPRAFTGSRIARELARAALGLPSLPPFTIVPEEIPRERSLAAEERKRYHGTYDVEWAGGPSPLAFWKGSYRIYDDDAGRLMLHMPGVIPEPLIYVGSDTFHIASDHEMRFTFVTRAGQATSLTVTQASNVLSGPRRPGS
jgi:CubicO group peptidase (beta-lactamase class C family)